MTEQRKHHFKTARKHWAKVALTSTLAGLVGAASPVLAETSEAAASQEALPAAPQTTTADSSSADLATVSAQAVLPSAAASQAEAVLPAQTQAAGEAAASPTAEAGPAQTSATEATTADQAGAGQETGTRSAAAGSSAETQASTSAAETQTSTPAAETTAAPAADNQEAASGEAASPFVQDDQGYYYLYRDGQPVTGYQTIEGKLYYFDSKGRQARGVRVHGNGTVRYYDPATGASVTNQLITDDKGDTYLLDKHGRALKGYQTIDGQLYYFDSKGRQAKGIRVHGNGTIRYYDPATGTSVSSQFITDDQGDTYYLDKHGRALKGSQTIADQHYHFAEDGKMVQGQWAADQDGNRYYYAPETGVRVTSRFITDSDNKTYYLGADGKPLTGQQIINGLIYYFNPDGSLRTEPAANTANQARQTRPARRTVRLARPAALSVRRRPTGRAAASIQLFESLTYRYSYGQSRGILSFFNQFVTMDGYTYYYGPDGLPLTGSQTINGKRYFFDREGRQIKGEVAEDENGVLRYYDEETGEMVFSKTLTLTKGPDAGRTITIDSEGVVTFVQD